MPGPWSASDKTTSSDKTCPPEAQALPESVEGPAKKRTPRNEAHDGAQKPEHLPREKKTPSPLEGPLGKARKKFFEFNIADSLQADPRSILVMTEVGGAATQHS